MTTTKRLATRYYQLKIGHAVIGVHLKRIKTIDDDRCWWCDSGERQSVKHLMKECRKWRESRETLKKNVKQHLWQHHDLQHLFANRDASKPLLEYLETTEIGNKTAEKDMERAEEERDEMWGWNVLEEEPEARPRDVDRDRMENRLRAANEFIAGVIAEIEAAGASRENG
jgi:23S rRNA A1618 N6-methylase RlmF